MNYGSEFGAYRRDENWCWDSEFKQYLEINEVRPILAMVKHPQNKRKIEKWFDAYDRFRYEFDSLDKFIVWYNNWTHGSLDFENLESPELSFWRRLPQEAVLGKGIRVFGWWEDETFTLSEVNICEKYFQDWTPASIRLMKKSIIWWTLDQKSKDEQNMEFCCFLKCFYIKRGISLSTELYCATHYIKIF